jgi:hypothetical protein
MKHTTVILSTFALLITLLHAQLVPTTQQQPTAAELAAQSITDALNSEITHRVAVHKVCFDTLWRNQREGATPAAILAALGTNAKLVFQIASENLAHISNCAALIGKARADFISDEDCTPPVAFTIHADGTVTLNQ